jgi:Fe-S cluster assembly protein SufD
MSVAAENKYLESLFQGRQTIPSGPVGWFNELRAEAVDRLGTLKLPTTRDEEWRFTDISPLANLSLQPARAGSSSLQVSDMAHLHLDEAAIRLVFVDGSFAPHLSLLPNTEGTSRDAPVMVGNLPLALSRQGEVKRGESVEQHLGKHVQFRNNLFAALNTAFLHDGALVMARRDAAIESPVHLLFIATQTETANHPRCLIIAEPGSAITIVEDYVALQEGVCVTNAVTEIFLADNSEVNHTRVQRDSVNAFHIANCAVSIGRASRYRSVNVAMGGRISRYDLNVLLAAESAECAIDGLALIGARQLADTHTCIDHAKANGTSRQLHKCIVDGAAHAVFNGKIMVRPYAQRTDSSQSSRNLLLNPRARVDTKPQLEIFADDVKCAHGATVGQLDNEELFYLKSRGLTETTARNLLTYAFGAEVIERIRIASLKRRLEEIVFEQTRKN